MCEDDASCRASQFVRMWREVVVMNQWKSFLVVMVMSIVGWASNALAMGEVQHPSSTLSIRCENDQEIKSQHQDRVNRERSVAGRRGRVAQ